MAITHVCTVFPHRNDLVDYETVRRLNTTVDEANHAMIEQHKPL